MNRNLYRLEKPTPHHYSPTLERSGGLEEKPTPHHYSPTLERSGGKEPPLHHYKRADILANRGKMN